MSVVKVTQEDRDAAADVMDAMGVDWGVCGDVREGRLPSPLPPAFARHRQSAIAELCEGLNAVLDTSGARGTYHSLRYSEAVERAEALLSKHSPDAPGQHAGTRAIEPSDGDEA